MKIKFLKDFMATQSDDFRDLHAILIKRGDIVDVDGCKYNDSYFDMPKEQAQWLIDNGFAEEVKESGWWEPNQNEKYYYLDGAGCITTDAWECTGFDTWRHEIGNIFKTYDAAKRYSDYLLAVATVRQDEGFMKHSRKINYSPCGYGVYRGFGESIIAEVSDATVSAGEFFFDNCEHAQASLDKHQDEWQTILNYDWSRE